MLGAKRVALIILLLLILGTTVLAQEIKVVATFSILEDFVREIGGERVAVSSLVPMGADPHAWEASPKEVRSVGQAQLLVANGGIFDAWLIPLAENAATKGTPLVFAGQGLPLLQEEHGGDPHLWLSIPNAIHYVEQITKALVAVSPENSSFFLQRSQAYIQKLQELDQQMVTQLMQIPAENRVLVSYHNAFSYLAERYGFRVEYLVRNSEEEPSPRDLGRLVQVLNKLKAPVVFTEPHLSAGYRHMQTVAREVKGRIYSLYSDSLSTEVSSYIGLMEYNLKVLVEALR